MYGLNAPVPGSVSRIASALHPELAGFDNIRERHSLLVKRLVDDNSVPRLQQRAREALAGAPPFEARVERLGLFEEPPSGSAPVIYLAVESPGLRRIHERLAEEFEPVEGLEGDSYTPHVTLARGGDWETAQRLDGREIDPVTWTVSTLDFWDPTYNVTVGNFSLPV